MQSKVTTNCDDSSWSEYKTWGLGGYILKKATKCTEIWPKNGITSICNGGAT